MQAVKDAIERAKGPEGDGLAGYKRLVKEARDLFQALSGEEQQNLLANLSESDRRMLEDADVGGRRRKSRKSRKTRRRRGHTRRHR